MPINDLSKALKFTPVPTIPDFSPISDVLMSVEHMRKDPADDFLTLPPPKMLLTNSQRTLRKKLNMEQKVTVQLGVEKHRSTRLRGLPRECDLSSFSDREIRRINLNWERSQHALNTKIFFAAQWGFTDYLDILLTKNRVNLNKAGALYMAAQSARLDTVKHLVEQRNADVNYCDENPLLDLPLHGAISSGNVECVSYLLSKGALVTTKGSHSKSAVEHCLNYGSLLKDSNKYEILKELIKAGASLDTYLSSRKTTARAYLEAKQIKHPAIAVYIATILSEAPCSAEMEPKAKSKRRRR